LAISDYTKVIELNPKSANVFNKRAFAYYLAGKYDQAWEDVHSAQNLGLQVSPEFLKELSEASSPKVLENITESESEDDDDELITYIK
jgi:tetratricopeptide (TPR) repeat protein